MVKENVFDRDSFHEPVSPRQVSPIPTSDLSGNVDRSKAVRDAIAAHPEAGLDEIVKILADQQIEVSATLVMQLMQHKPASNNST